MRVYLFLAVLSLAVGVFAADIIPVKEWPTRIGTSVYNPTVDQCVKAGYRILVAKPSTPAGKRIKSEKIIQDPAAPEKCKYEITYEDAPVVTPPPPEVITNVSVDRIIFRFTTNGAYRGMVWLDAPKTNKVEK